MDDNNCTECHPDITRSWEMSMHRNSSFNNPAYKFSVDETREFLKTRDGDVKTARLCAVCHDPAPLFSGKFDDPDFDGVNDPTAHAGLTCISCHAITEINPILARDKALTARNDRFSDRRPGLYKRLMDS